MKRVTILIANSKGFIRTLFLVFTFFNAVLFSAFAQSRIHGKVVDAKGEPVINANVLLLTLKDSVLAKGILTNEEGAYSFENINAGNYLINATHTGIKPVSSQPFQISDKGDNIDAGTLQLDEVDVIL